MNIILPTLALMIGLNLMGLIASYYTLKHGVPATTQIQSKPSTREAFEARLPLIGLNLVLLIGGAVMGLFFVQDSFSLIWPGIGTVLLGVLWLILVDDSYFYFFHRTLHHPKLYRFIHRLHHKAYAPLPLDYIYAHPLEWSLGAGGPVIGLVVMMGVMGEINAWIFWIYAGFRTFHELWIHSGRRSTLMRWIPLSAPNEHHDLHHAKPTLGNYGSTLRFWDRILGTEIR